MPYLAVPSPWNLANKAQIYYEDRTVEQGRTILFLHDWPLNRQSWAYPVALFSRGYRTITIDLPGFGRSDDPGGLISLESLARDVGAVGKVLSLTNVVLVGAGLGAAVALAYARCFPRMLAGLVLVGPLAPRWTRADDFPHGIPRGDVERLLEASETEWPAILASYVGSLFHTAVDEQTRLWFMAMGFEASLYAVQQCLIALREADQRDDLRAVTVPTAIFHGAHDAIAPPGLGEYLAGALPNATITRFEHSGHAVWVDDKMRFNRELTGFIEGRVFGNVLPPPNVESTPGGGKRLRRPATAAKSRAGETPLEGPTGEVYE
jgi:pimeloyl-ACP methyl ester carboxylesterase